MIITDKFVYIHMPKTGGTFVETVLRKIHERRGDMIEERRSDERPRFSLKKLLSRRPVYLKLFNQNEVGEWNQHGKIGQIPPAHRDKPILTTLRNPYDRYVSQYEFKWWKTHPGTFSEDVAAIKAQYPAYPEITFEEFVFISNTFFGGGENTRFSPEDRLGRHTTQFVTYFFRDPARLADIDAAYLAERRYEADIHPNIHYAFTHDLNRQLYDFLRGMGYPHDDIALILQHQKVLPDGQGRTDEQKWEKYYTPELKAYVRHHERMLFDLFPVFDC